MSQADVVWKKLVRMLGAVPEDEDASSAVLGRMHPLTRALSFTRTVATQLLVSTVTVPIGVLALAARVTDAPELLGAASLVTVALSLTLVIARGSVRERVIELLAAGSDRIPLAVVQRERSRLISRTERERLARSLERLLADVQSARSRLLPGVAKLGYVFDETTEVVHTLRQDGVNVRGVALTHRLLSDGSESPLYSGDLESLRQELRRIHFLLTDAACVTKAYALAS